MAQKSASGTKEKAHKRELMSLWKFKTPVDGCLNFFSQIQFTSGAILKSTNLTSFTSTSGFMGKMPMKREKSRKRGFKWPSEEDLGKCLKLLQIAKVVFTWMFS
tara:strand:+ start:442 stop:753 length:312 start_codon:yes stop_codon:yes gene_type:complete